MRSARRRPILRATTTITSAIASFRLCSASATSATEPDRAPPAICASVSATFIATSLDGYIADTDEDLDWLASGAGDPAEDYGYAEFMKTVDVLLMGRRTYQKVLGFDAWPYAGRRVIVASRSLPASNDAPPGGVEVAGDELAELFERLAADGAERVYVDGGRLITSCLAAGLIDELVVTRVPVVLGGGVPLFGSQDRPVRLEHVATRAYPSGFVQSRYRRPG